MTLEEINELVDEIQQVLVSESEPLLEELMDLAGRHEDYVYATIKRLKAVDALLSKGLRSEAIELAEREPNLNDVVISLDFPELDAWNELLAQSEMQPVPALPDDLAAELNDAYSVSAPVEKLLQRHRTAALGRAPLATRIDILRRLATSDSGNPAWPQDLKLFEQQRLTELKGELEIAVREKNIDALAALEREASSPDWKVSVPADLKRKINDANSRLRQAGAKSELDTLSYQLSDAFADFDLPTARKLGQRFRALAQIVSLSSGDPLMDIAGPALDWISDEDQKAQREAQHLQKVKEIEDGLNQNVHTERLERLHYEATLHGHALPERLASRLADRLETLRVNAGRRRRTIIIALVAAVMVLIGATGMAIRHVGIRNTVTRHVDQLGILLQEAEKTGVIDPLNQYFELLAQEPANISQSAEITGLRQRFEVLRTSETSRVAQIDQILSQATADAQKAAMPGEFDPLFEGLKTAEELAKNTAERTRIMVTDTLLSERRSSLQKQVDTEFSGKVTEMTEVIAALPKDNLTGYDDVVRQLTEMQSATDVSAGLIDSVTALRSKVLTERSEVSLQMQMAKGLQETTNAVGNLAGFSAQLQKYAETHPGSTRSADFQSLLNFEQSLWKGALAWNDMRTRLLAVDIARISPRDAKTLVDDFSAFQKSSGPYAGDMNLGNRLLALQAVAQRRINEEATLTDHFRSVFDGKAISSSFLIKAEKSEDIFYADAAPLFEKNNLVFDYFTTPSGDQTIAKKLTANDFPFAAARKRDEWLSPQSRLASSILAQLEEMKEPDFEATLARMLTRILQEEPELDPILRLLLAERMLKAGSDGSVYIAKRSEKSLDEIAGAGIPKLTNWVDYQDLQTKKLRVTAEAFLEKQKMTMIAAAAAAQADRDSAKEEKIGPSLRWVGWLTRNAKADWEILLKTGVALDGGNKLCVFQKITPTSMPERVIVATVDANSAIKLTDEVGQTSTTEGRPVFQILESE
jgi:hypothetical protein